MIHIQSKQPYFDKTPAPVGRIINKTWCSHYSCSQYIIYDNGSEFKLHFETLCESYGLKHKPTSVRNPQANAILEWVHQTIIVMLRTAEIDMPNTITESDIADFFTNEHGPFALPTSQYVEPHQVWQSLVEACCLMSHTLPTGQNRGI